MYSKIKYKNIKVSYRWRLNGGGLILAHEFVHIVSRRIGKVEHVFEYCAGPGFIGFCLLANNLCDKLTLADVNPHAITVIQETIKNNNLQDRVNVYQSDYLESIPESEQWDLVVGNPPWYISPKNRKDIMVCDPESRVHEEFYRKINKFLKPNGTILFVEGGGYTNTAYFKDMIEKNGLSITASYRMASLSDIIKNLGEYTGVNIALAFFLRFCIFFREIYFVSSKKNGGGVMEPLYSDTQKGDSKEMAYSKGEIIQIARKQKILCWLLLGLLIGFLLKSTFIERDILSIFQFLLIIIAYQLLVALRTKWPFIYLIGMIVPEVSVIITLYLNLLSAKILKANKINVGLMGAKNIPLDEQTVAL